MTPAQHTALARLSDGEWREGRALGRAGVLAWLLRADLIRDDMSSNCMEDRLWTITPDGLDALNRAAS